MGVLVIVVSVLLVASAFGEQCGTMVIKDPRPAPIIVGGNDTSYGEFPWLATLQYIQTSNGINAGMKCAGFIINNRFVVTAARCLRLENYTLTKVVLGVRQITLIDTDDANIVRKYDVEAQIPHENYSPITHKHDIALLKLKTPIKYSDYIRPICLPAANAGLPPSGTLLWVAGWGQIGLNGERSDIKLKVEVPMYSHQVCEEKYNYTVKAEQLCTEGEEQKGTCLGDQGAPLMLPTGPGIDRYWTAIGLVSNSKSKGCGLQGTPVIHTRVSSYVNWIAQHVES